MRCGNPACREGEFQKIRHNQIYCSPKCRIEHWLATHPRVPTKGATKPRHIRKHERTKTPVTIGEKSDIKAAIDIIKVCATLADSATPFGGAVNVPQLNGWLDSYAATSSQPLEALVMIRRRIPNFAGTLTLKKCEAL